MAEEFAITYGAVTIGAGGDSAYLRDQKFTLEVERFYARVELEVVVSHATLATFLAKEAALVAAFSTPRQRLRVQVSGSDRYDFDPDANTGFDHVAKARKIGETTIEDTRRSARYRLTVACSRPATTPTGVNGRGDVRFSAEQDSSRWYSVTIAGFYTATPSGQPSVRTALAAYRADADTYCDTLLDLVVVGGVWKKEQDDATPNDTNKRVEFVRRYRQVFVNESVAALKVDALIGPVLKVSAGRSWPGDAARAAWGDTLVPADWVPAAIRPVEVVLAYSSGVDKAVHSGAAALKALYTTTVRPLLLANARAASGGGAVVMLDEKWEPVIYSNRLEATMVCRIYPGGVVSASLDVDESDDLGKTFVAVHNGNPYARNKYEGPRTIIRTVTRTVIRARGSSAGGGGGIIAAAGAGSSDLTPPAGWEALAKLRRTKADKIGGPGEAVQLDLIVDIVPMLRCDVVGGENTTAGTRVQTQPGLS